MFISGGNTYFLVTDVHGSRLVTCGDLGDVVRVVVGRKNLSEETRKHTLELISTEGKFLETGVSYDCPRQAGMK